MPTNTSRKKTAPEQTLTEAIENVPAVYRVPASKASLDQNRFKFQLPDEDKPRSIPKLQFLKPRIAVRIEGMKMSDALILLVEEYHPDLIDRLDGLDQLEGLMEAWQKASGISVGESKPS